MPDVFDRSRAHQRLWPRGALGDQPAGARGVHDLQVFVGAGKFDRVAGCAAKPHRTVDLLQPGEARPCIGHPVELAVLAVADDVDLGVDLLLDHLGDGPADTRRERLGVVGFTQFLGVEHRDEIAGPRQAAGVGGEDPARAALHSFGPLFSGARQPGQNDSNFSRLLGSVRR